MAAMKVGWLGLAAASGLLFAQPGWGKEPAGLDLARQLSQAFVTVAQRASPAVVFLKVVSKPAIAPVDAQDDEAFESLPPGFWRRFHEELRTPPPETTEGEGSGVIIRPDGYILTNFHVVENADRIDVRLSDGRSFRATLRGVDRPSDLAVVKIDAQDLPTATLGDSTKAGVGEFAIAIGAPFGLEGSVTFGHISAKGRANVLPGFEDGGIDQDFIQTDALINPGNSGGPLLDINGEVIGINTCIRGSHSGIGFAVPSNLAREVSEQLIAKGRYTRPWLGLDIAAVRELPDLRSVIPGLVEGVVVASILPNGPAAKSELKPADVITAVDGRRVTTPQQLREQIRRKAIGQAVTLEVLRQGKTRHIQVSPVEWAEPVAAVSTSKHATTAVTRNSRNLGLTVQLLTRELAEKFGADSTDGVLVAGVEQNSIAAQRNLKAGDIITSVNQQPVLTPKQFQDAVARADLAKGVLLNLVSDRTARFEILKGE